MDKVEAQQRVDEVAKAIEAKGVVFKHLQEQIEAISDEVNALRVDLLNELDENFDWDEYYQFHKQLEPDWLPSSYQC